MGAKVRAQIWQTPSGLTSRTSRNSTFHCVRAVASMRSPSRVNRGCRMRVARVSVRKMEARLVRSDVMSQQPALCRRAPSRESSGTSTCIRSSYVAVFPSRFSPAFPMAASRTSVPAGISGKWKVVSVPTLYRWPSRAPVVASNANRLRSMSFSPFRVSMRTEETGRSGPSPFREQAAPGSRSRKSKRESILFMRIRLQCFPNSHRHPRAGCRP